VHDRNVVGAIKLSDFWMAAVGGLIYQLVRVFCYKYLTEYHTKACLEKDPLKKPRYVERAIESTAKSAFHITAFIWGWYALREVGWLPWCLGGSTTIRELFTTQT